VASFCGHDNEHSKKSPLRNLKAVGFVSDLDLFGRIVLPRVSKGDKM
jgi:hypothetical protein